MWILVHVDEIEDVGKNENERFLISDGLVITALIKGNSRVHPAKE